MLELDRFTDDGNPHADPSHDYPAHAAPAGRADHDLTGTRHPTVSVKTLIEQTAALADQRSSANETTYRQLVRECAGPNPPSPERILERLKKLDRDVGEFQQALETYSRRIELRAEYDQRTARHRRRTAIADQIAEAEAVCRAKIQAAEDELAALAAPLLQEDAELKAGVERARKAGEELTATCSYPEVHAAIREADTTVRAAIEKRQNFMQARHGQLTPGLLANAQATPAFHDSAQVKEVRAKLPEIQAWQQDQSKVLDEAITRAKAEHEAALARRLDA